MISACWEHNIYILGKLCLFICILNFLTKIYLSHHHIFWEMSW
jgi:hypothetical protein